MSDQPDGASPAEAAAHRRWLITLAITVLFGGFGAVMAYLSYANSSKPAASSPRSPGRSPSKSPAAAPTPAPAAPAAVEPSAPAPSDDEKGKSGKDGK
jgi:hypothetical protein